MTRRRRAALLAALLGLLLLLLTRREGVPPSVERNTPTPRAPVAERPHPRRPESREARLFRPPEDDPPPPAPAPAPASAVPRPAELAFTVEAAESGEPLPGAEVKVSASCLPEGAPAPRIAGEGGRFVITGLVAGGARLEVSAPGRARRIVSATLGGGRDEIDGVRLFRSGTVAGALLDREGKPLEGAMIRARAPWRGVTVEALVDDEGRFRLEGLPQGPVLLSHSESPDDMLVVGVDADGVVEAAWGGAPRIAGTSLGASGEPSDNVVAFPLSALSDPLKDYRALTEGEFPGTRMADVDGEDGTFSFGGLPAGEWWVGNEVSHAVVLVEEGAAEPVRVDLRPWFVNGRLHGPPGEFPILLAVPEGALEPALRGDRHRLLEVLAAVWRVREGDEIAPDETGAFSLPVPGPGRYQLFVLAFGMASEGPVLVAAAERPGPGTAEVAIQHAGTLRFSLEGEETAELVLLVARDEKGAVSALGVSEDGARGSLSLPARRLRVGAHTGGGRVFEAEVFVPTEADVEVVLAPR